MDHQSHRDIFKGSINLRPGLLLPFVRQMPEQGEHLTMESPTLHDSEQQAMQALDAPTADSLSRRAIISGGSGLASGKSSCSLLSRANSYQNGRSRSQETNQAGRLGATSRGADMLVAPSLGDSPLLIWIWSSCLVTQLESLKHPSFLCDRVRYPRIEPRQKTSPRPNPAKYCYFHVGTDPVAHGIDTNRTPRYASIGHGDRIPHSHVCWRGTLRVFWPVAVDRSVSGCSDSIV
jgi:hypothetical protein